MARSRSVNTFLASFGAALLASTALAVAMPANAAAAGCSVNYAVSSQWPGGFGANVTITNLGDPLTSWTLTWSFGAGQTVTQSWNTTLTQSGTAITARNVSYNGAIPTNGTTSFGFNGSWTSSNPTPTDFALNGVTCTGGVHPHHPTHHHPTDDHPAHDHPADDSAAVGYVQSAVVVPVVVDGAAGAAAVGLGVVEGLHARAVQRSASGVRDHARQRHVVGVDELRAVLELEPDGFGESERDAVLGGRAVVVLLRAA